MPEPSFRPDPAEELAGRWRSFHLHYHGDRSRLLLELYRPLVARLVREGRIDRFFFVRLNLGGPHLRLRFRLREPGQEGAFLRTFHGTVEAYLARHPSTESLDEAAIRELNRRILFDESGGPRDRVLPDNHVREMPFLPEWKLYGEPDAMPAALTFFNLSTLHALDFLDRQRDATPGQTLVAGARFLMRLCLGLASDAEQVGALCSYAAELWGGGHQTVLRRADRDFSARADTYRALVVSEVEAYLAAEDGTDPRSPSEAARRLAWRERELEADTRRRRTSSHLHQAMDRIGLVAGEEIYLGRLLELGAAALRGEELWRRLDEHLRRTAARPPRGSLDDLLDRTGAVTGRGGR